MRDEKLSSPNGTIRLVTIQFMCSSACIARYAEGLSVVGTKARETDSERERRKGRNATNEIKAALITPTKRVLVGNPFPEGGYELVDASKQRRRNDRGVFDTVVTFLFAKTKYATPSKEFVAIRPQLLGAFYALSEGAMWRMQGFRNPVILEGKNMEGQYHISLNAKEREPLYRDDGTPILLWAKDEDGVRIGKAPSVPVAPDYRLLIVGNKVALEPY